MSAGHAMHHSKLVGDMCGNRGYELGEDDQAKPGEHPAVFPVLCYSLAKFVKANQIHLKRHGVFAFGNPCDDGPGWILHTHTYTGSKDVFVQGWPTIPLFVDVCSGVHPNFRRVDNLYTLSNLGSSGVAKTTTASFLGELVHKFVYLDLCRRCHLSLSPDNRFAMAVRETKHQTKGVPLASRMTRVISRRLPVPTWVVYDRGQPSVLTVPGLYFNVNNEHRELGFPRCIPDQILRRGDDWMVCEYKTRYGEKPNSDSSNLVNAKWMVVQCIWQAVAFRLCTGHARVHAKAIEVAVRSNRVVGAETRVLEWECGPDALPAWFGWALLCSMDLSSNAKTYTSNLSIQYARQHWHPFEIHKHAARLTGEKLEASCYVCRFIYSLVRGYAVTDGSRGTQIHPIVRRLCKKKIHLKTLKTPKDRLVFYTTELRLFGAGS